MLVEQADEVAAVVHRDLGMGVGDLVEMAVVGVAVLAVAGVAADPVGGDERRRHIVLRRERVRRREGDLGAAGLQRAHQVGRLGGHVEAGADAQAREGLLALEALADQAQDRHLSSRPLDPADAFVGQAEVDDVVGRKLGGGGCHQRSVSLRGERKRRSGPGRLGQVVPTRWISRSSKRTCSW